MHKAAVALLAVPILAVVYLGALLRRSTIARASLAIGLAIVLGVGVVGATRPTLTVATPPTVILPLTQGEFQTTVTTDRALVEPVTISFTAPMDARSVASAVTVDPPTAVTLDWDATGTKLTISPTRTWTPGVLHTVTVQPGALDQTGQPLARPARAVFLTRPRTTGSAAATDVLGTRVSIDSTFSMTFGGPVDPATVREAVRLDPPVPGTVIATDRMDGLSRYEFVPTGPLAPDTRYRLTVAGVHDTDGLALAPFSILVRTSKAPSVIRFRPRSDTLDVARDSAISVRFSKSMDRGTTAKAFAVNVNRKPIAGTIAWAESDTVLVFTPKAALPFGTVIVATVAPTATGADGAPLAEPGRAIFRTVRKPAAAPKAPATVRTATKKTTSTPSKSSSGGGGGGGAVGGGSWAAVERYYLGLMNCTRTGGWVTSSGSCSSPGGRNVAALRLDAGISSRVTRPYAKKLAVNNECSHFIGGNPGDRLRAAGYSSYRWAENIGCRSGNAYSAVLGSHLFFQAEKSSNGGHYVNLMNAAYSRVGIGVWVSSGRVRLVIDFYHP